MASEMCYLVPTHATKRFLLWDPKTQYELLLYSFKFILQMIESTECEPSGEFVKLSCINVSSPSSAEDPIHGLCTLGKCFTRKLHAAQLQFYMPSPTYK